jgi:UDP-N-acetylmuramate--alanine ligase
LESLDNISDEQLQNIIQSVGKQIFPHEFKKNIDFAFLTLHGSYGEDGNIQGILEWAGIPYSGSGILPSAIGISKSIQKEMLAQAGFAQTKSMVLTKKDWLKTPYKGDILENLIAKIGLPMVIKAPNQGSSIGISVLTEKDNHEFIRQIHKALFIQEIGYKKWTSFSENDKITFLTQLTDIREGIGFPLVAEIQYIDNTNPQKPIVTIRKKDILIYHPEKLWSFLDENLNHNHLKAVLTNTSSEESVLLERFILGKEFSCIVIQNENDEPVALPPTEILKKSNFFDYRGKYLPGISRKITPIDIPNAHIENIRKECCRLYKVLNINVYARIDGFINSLGEVFLNDPNTTSGMLPSSFFFHQAAEIGLNPSQFLTYIIRTSLCERIKTGKDNYFLHKKLEKLDTKILEISEKESSKIKVAVLMGGFSSERHISVESGRNIFEKLASSQKYEPIPVFLTGNEQNHELYILPTNIMLKDNADDIKEKVKNWEQNIKNENAEAILEKIQNELTAITSKYAKKAIFKPEKITYKILSERVKEVFIALHGRPGEDGAVQTELEKVGLSYNGSGEKSSKITINKYETNEILASNGILVAEHCLVFKSDYQEKPVIILENLEKQFLYPFIAKPADDGCSSAVKKIKNREELIAYIQQSFRETDEFLLPEAQILKLKPTEEFPKRTYFLVEELIDKNDCVHFLEVTGGMLTKFQKNEHTIFEVFEPSETLSAGEVLSLEEKFLAGEGQNITPARFSKNKQEQQRISEEVRKVLEKTAKLLNVEGYCRIDAFVRVYADGRVETVIIEINSLPGMTPATCIFHQAALNGYKPYNFIDAILEYGKAKLAL